MAKNAKDTEDIPVTTTVTEEAKTDVSDSDNKEAGNMASGTETETEGTAGTEDKVETGTTTTEHLTFEHAREEITEYNKTADTATAEESEPDYTGKAEELMERENKKEIWRDSATGYWYTRKDYVEENEKKSKHSFEYYKL